MASPHPVSSLEPHDELDPDEPRTPGWMPLLGMTLFVVGGIAFAKYGPTQQNFPKPQAELSPAAAAAGPSAAAPSPQPPPNPAAARGMAPPGMPGQRPQQPQQGG